MKVLKIYLLLLVSLILFITFTAYNVSTSKGQQKVYHSVKKEPPQDNREVIKFSHTKHLKEAGMECRDCHTKAPGSEKSSDALTPVKPTCSACHDVEDTKECSLCHYEGVQKKLVASVKELSFSHKKHLSLGKKCEDCHINMGNYKYSNDNPNKYPSMDNCYACHNDREVTNACEACHTNTTNLVPVNHLSSNFLNEHKGVINLSDKNNNCMMCHSDNFCQVCHSAAGYKGKNAANDFFAPYYTKGTGTIRTRAELKKLNTVHDLNYLYTHGLDAQQKTYECKTCHDVGNFCAACHNNGGNVMTGIMPRSHINPNFKTIGVNTGGGLHAELARKDVESCQACHDVNGADPVCIRCHFDNDGVQGTNPKTHEKGFLNDEKGIWHDTQGAVCYTCHTDPNARPNGIFGIGFCGYCHK